jgi:hypothetical protein
VPSIQDSELLVYGDFAVELNESAICLSMAHDVFISHAHKDKRMAVAICKKLESAQVSCWIAERDISAGQDWTEATRNAIGSSRVMVLVLSENANAAPHIEREIAHAFYTKRTIFPVRLTETPPKRDFLFYLGNVRWFEAFTSPPEQHLEELAASINGIVHGHTINRDIMPPPKSTTDEARKTLQYSDSWLGALRASHYGALEMLKRITIAASVLAAIWLLWFVYSQMKHVASLPEGDVQTMNSARGTAPNSTPKGTADLSASKPTYTYTRLGLWVPSNAGATPSHEERSYDAQSIAGPTPSAGTISSPHPNDDQIAADEKEGSGIRDRTSAKPVQQHSPGIGDRTAPLAVEPSPTQVNKPATGDTEPGKLAETNQSQADDPLSSPPVAPSVKSTPLEAQSGRGLKASPEEQSIKELVLEYLRTVASNDGSAQERLFAGRVSFYGKGVLSFSEIGACMERYRREWPIRKWEPKGEPEFPSNLQSSNPDLYEVLQPFAWTVTNGSKHKQGSATLYVKIRKAENGTFHIFHLEQRHL